MNKSKNKVVVNYLYNTVYEVLRLLAPLITTPYVSRILGADGVGTYSYAQSIATYFMLVGAVGTTLYGQREIAYVQDDPQRRTRVFWEIFLFRFATSIACTIAYYLAFCNGTKYAIVYRVLTLEVAATAIDISWFFMGIENFRVTVIRNTIIKLVGIALVFLLVKKPEDVPLYTMCVTLPIFIGNLSLWLNVRKYLDKVSMPRWPDISRHIKPILILFIPQVAIEVYAVLDKTMIGLLSPDIGQVGYYTQAQKIIKLLLTIILSVGTVMLPAMSVAFAQGKRDEIERRLMTAFRFIFMMSSALLFGVCAVARRFVPIFFGEGYMPVVTLMIVIAPVLVIIGISNVIGKQYLLPTKQQAAFTASVVTGAVLNCILNYILIQRFDAIGASVATVVAEMGVTAVQIWHVRKQLPLGKCFLPLIKYLLFGAIMFLGVRVLDGLLPEGIPFLCAMIAAGAILYALELIISKDQLLAMGKQLIAERKSRG